MAEIPTIRGHVLAVFDLLMASEKSLPYCEIVRRLPDVKPNTVNSAISRLRKLGALNRFPIEPINGKPAYMYELSERGRQATVDRTPFPARRKPAAKAPPVLPPPVSSEQRRDASPAPMLIHAGDYRFSANHIIFVDESKPGAIFCTLDLTEIDVQTGKRQHRIMRFEGSEARQVRACLDTITINADAGQGDEATRLREELTAAEQLASEAEVRAQRAEAELVALRKKLRSLTE